MSSWQLPAALALAVVIDAAVRLPNALHPVAWLGSLTNLVLRWAPTKGRALPFAFGLVLALGMPVLAVTLVQRLLGVLPAEGSHADFAVGVLVQACVLHASFTLFGLLHAGTQLREALSLPELSSARTQLLALCSRDPSELDQTKLTSGGLESLAENLSDSVVAPLFFLCCFGLEGAVAYRAINTLDAMIGYRGRYEWLGKAAARLDDLANLVPARLTVLALMLAAGIARPARALDLRRGLSTWSRDRLRTESPNSGHPMAMAAGLLGVRLEKTGHHVLGAQLPRPTPADLDRGLLLVRDAGLLVLAAVIALLASRAWRDAQGFPYVV